MFLLVFLLHEKNHRTRGRGKGEREETESDCRILTRARSDIGALQRLTHKALSPLFCLSRRKAPALRITAHHWHDQVSRACQQAGADAPRALLRGPCRREWRGSGGAGAGRESRGRASGLVCPRAHINSPKHARAARHAQTLCRLLAAGSAASWLTVECCDWAWPHRRRTSCANA